MKLPLMLLLTLITFSSQAQIAGDSPGSPFTMTCMVVLLMICLLTAGVVFLLMNNKKRGRINENNNSGKNT